MKPHSTKASQLVGVTLTFIIEILFSFLAGWAMFDEFGTWGVLPAIVVGVLAGAVFLLLGLYVFILREYAIDANKVFARIRNESAAGRIGWAVFLVVLVVIVESFINANRMSVLPIPNVDAKVFLWIMFQALVFVPLALGKLVHGHVNATDPAIEERKFYNELDSAFYKGVQGQLSGMSLSEIAQLRQGNTAPLHQRMQAETDEKARALQPEAPHPLAEGLRTISPQPQTRAGQNGRN